MKKKAKPVAKARSPGKVARSAGKPKSRAKVAAKTRSVAVEQPVAVPAAPAADAFLLALESSCTLREIADLQFSLVAARGDPLVIDGGSVERVDTAGLQLLVALARRQQQAGGRLEWKAVSPELLKSSERLGLAGALCLPASGEAP